MAVNLSGEWTSSYSYHDGGDTSQHIIVFEGDANVKGKSLPQPDDSKLSLRLSYDDTTNTLTGTWREVTSPAGKYKGKAFHGALQLILNKAGDKAEGMWLGFSSDLTRINSGKWKLNRR